MQTGFGPLRSFTFTRAHRYLLPSELLKQRFNQATIVILTLLIDFEGLHASGSLRKIEFYPDFVLKSFSFDIDTDNQSVRRFILIYCRICVDENVRDLFLWAKSDTCIAWVIVILVALTVITVYRRQLSSNREYRQDSPRFRFSETVEGILDAQLFHDFQNEVTQVPTTADSTDQDTLLDQPVVPSSQPAVPVRKSDPLLVTSAKPKSFLKNLSLFLDESFPKDLFVSVCEFLTEEDLVLLSLTNSRLNQMISI